MPIIKKILIVIVILIFSFILYRLFQRRAYLLKIQENTIKPNSLKEGLSEESPDYANVLKDVDKIAIVDKSALVINNINNNNRMIPLMHFCIKGSYNSAYSGDYVSDEMVKYVLSRGCRFLDFELYYLPKSNKRETYNLYVGYESDSLALNPRIKNKEIPLFYDILKSTIVNAFTQQINNKYYTKNVDDPLFIQIRMKCDSTVSDKAYVILRRILDALFKKETNGFSQYQYINKVDPNNPIRSLMRKVIFVFEQDPNNTKYLDNYVNIELNGSQLSKQLYSSVNTSKFKTTRPKIISTTQTDVTKMVETVPDPNVKSQDNLNFYSSIYNYGYQINMMQYYVNDSKLQNYESMFNSYKSSFVPMVNCLNYIEDYGASEIK